MLNRERCLAGESLRVRGLVQGVGFRPTVWRLAHECGLSGEVSNDSEGVLIHIWGDQDQRDRFRRRLLAEPPPLARIDSLESSALDLAPVAAGFSITTSHGGVPHTGIVADAATCAACRTEIQERGNRRYRYAFTNCTHCGPRLSIIDAIPYDRIHTSMRAFSMCAKCEHEYQSPADRRFHAQPNACPDCGPQLWLEAGCGSLDALGPDPIQRASDVLQRGGIVALKGLGGFHLACDAANPEVLETLRNRKHRARKPFALMARDLDVIRRYCRVDEDEAALLCSAAAPVVLLAIDGDRMPANVAPGQHRLGFMLPYTPMHILLLRNWDSPLAMTSGNASGEPQCIDNDEARDRLSALADQLLLHDRAILNRVDDSVAAVWGGTPHLLRRARGYAPAPLQLPAGFRDAKAVLATGADLKNTFCLLQDGQAIVSQHQGDLHQARTFDAYTEALELYCRLYRHRPQNLATDAHPGYRSTRHGRVLAKEYGLTPETVQHHHAHVAACLADNRRDLLAPPVLGIVLDGLGLGTDGTLWGAEFLLCDYRHSKRLGHLLPAPLVGGENAIKQPWRSTWSQLAHHLGWPQVVREWGHLELIQDLQERPLQMLAGMVDRGINSPLSSSAGRLFDAVAAALGICRDRISYEAEAAMELETRARSVTATDGYPFAQSSENGGQVLDPSPMWRALLNDLGNNVPASNIAAKFHHGLSIAIADLAIQLATRHKVGTVALSGGVFQNRLMDEAIGARLASRGLQVLRHRQVPTNDGGISLGQAVVCAARELR